MPDRAAISARIAHDLKAALSPIQTSAYVLKQGNAVAESVRGDVVAVIERQTARLARMIDEAAEWQRWCDDGVRLRPATIDPEFLLSTSTDELPGHPRVHWTNEPNPDFQGDERRLQQMLATLLAFACVRDPERSPRCEVALERDCLRVTIDDRGPACDPADLLAAPLLAPWDDGLGLGLLIASAIARAHGGTLTASSTPDGLRLACSAASLRSPD